MNKTMKVLVVSCDSHLDVLNQYMYFFRLNWPDCPFEVFVSIEEANIDDAEATVIKCGKNVKWTNEVLMSLDQINAEYVLLTVDDFYISKQIDTKQIIDALDFVVDNNIKYYRIPRENRPIKDEDLFKGQQHISRIRTDAIYSVSIGSAIWEKEELKRILGDGTMSAWEIEEHYTKVAKNASRGYYDGYVSDSRPLLQCAHMVTNGKWIPAGLKDMDRQGYHIKIGERQVLSFGEVLSMNLKMLANRIVPKKFRNPLKKAMTSIGFNFASKE